MNKKIIAATGNKNKLIELRRILAPFGVEVLASDKAYLSGIIENGNTFEENSLIKARHVFKLTNLPTIADDSGICIDFLDGKPGVYSARFLGEDTPYTIKNKEIIKMLENAKGDGRKAHYECVISVVTAFGEYTFSGRCDGFIGFCEKGSNGFGYDPIFCCNNQKSYAELTDTEKDEISHRGIALRKLSESFEQIKF